MPKIEISCLQSNASSSFLQTCINFVEQQLKFSHFEGSVIPQVIFCQTQFGFLSGILQQKKQCFSFYGPLTLTSFKKKNPEENNFQII